MTNKPSHIVNGIIEQGVSPLDRGLAYGDGVFRTLIVSAGIPEQWPLHYQKLVADCGALGIVCPAPELLINDIQQLFQPKEKAVAKIIISRGEGDRGYALPAVTSPMRVVIKTPFPDYPRARFTEGVELHVCACQLGYQPMLAGVKHLNRLENVLARMEWNNPELADGLMLDQLGNVVECTSANLFARFGDVLITPNLSQCGVAGVTRQRILDVAYTLGLKTQIEVFDMEKLFSADEVLICNSLYGAWQVRKILDQKWPQQPLAAQLRNTLIT
jgi:4-amino-4-deoxychorismate lyase